MDRNQNMPEGVKPLISREDYVNMMLQKMNETNYEDNPFYHFSIKLKNSLIDGGIDSKLAQEIVLRANFDISESILVNPDLVDKIIVGYTNFIIKIKQSAEKAFDIHDAFNIIISKLTLMMRYD